MFKILVLLLSFKAYSLDLEIESAARKYNIDARIMKAILQIESSGGSNVKLRHNSNGTYDIGPFQINSIHWNTTCKAYDLTTDKGNTRCAAKLLAKHKKHKTRDPMWAARYHSRTPSLKLKYYKKITKVLKQQSDK
jgi:hypothetical protein